VVNGTTHAWTAKLVRTLNCVSWRFGAPKKASSNIPGLRCAVDHVLGFLTACFTAPPATKIPASMAPLSAAASNTRGSSDPQLPQHKVVPSPRMMSAPLASPTSASRRGEYERGPRTSVTSGRVMCSTTWMRSATFRSATNTPSAPEFPRFEPLLQFLVRPGSSALKSKHHCAMHDFEVTVANMTRNTSAEVIHFGTRRASESPSLAE